jgi:hypothetical protein
MIHLDKYDGMGDSRFRRDRENLEISRGRTLAAQVIADVSPADAPNVLKASLDCT